MPKRRGIRIVLDSLRDVFAMLKPDGKYLTSSDFTQRLEQTVSMYERLSCVTSCPGRSVGQEAVEREGASRYP